MDFTTCPSAGRKCCHTVTHIDDLFERTFDQQILPTQVEEVNLEKRLCLSRTYGYRPSIYQKPIRPSNMSAVRLTGLPLHRKTYHDPSSYPVRLQPPTFTSQLLRKYLLAGARGYASARTGVVVSPTCLIRLKSRFA
jgi:hypothetical protein